MNGSMSTRRRLVGALMGAAALALAVALARPAHADAPPTGAPASPGVWQQHKLSFQYLGFTSTYSCQGVADKLRLLLLSSGARSDVKSEPGACANGFDRPDKFARADLTFYTLSPGSDTPGAAADAGAAAKPVAGVWKPVKLAARTPMDLGTGDCELVEQFRDQLLKKFFTTRALDDHTSCIPYQNSGSLIDLEFQVFTAAPTRSGEPGAPPAPIAR